MGLTITDETLAQMIRDLAERKGVSVDEVVRDAVEREAAEADARVERLVAIALEAVALPTVEAVGEDEILGYDADGIPHGPTGR